MSIPDEKKSIFYYRPKPGDLWEFKLPGKRKQTKVVGRIYSIWYRLKAGRQGRKPTVHWARLPKGRYSSIRVKWLLKYGRLVRRPGQ